MSNSIPGSRAGAAAAPNPDDDVWWEAVRRRDRGMDGVFLYSVRTTGVYCQPSCAARLPRRENVDFHKTCVDAERAGFRACRRCRPDRPAPTEPPATTKQRAQPSAAPLVERLGALDWEALSGQVDARGHATTGRLLIAEECEALVESYEVDDRFRGRIDMARHGFGRGEYRYFAYPLPGIVAALRVALYPALAAIANRWNAAMGTATRYPDDLEAFLKRCHAAGQAKPTPLLLRYRPGDYNCLHQDVYGGHIFPLQAVILLSRPADDFAGGELVLTEQRPRMQSRVEVVPLVQGEGAIFPVRHRPVQGSRRTYRVTMRHGVSRVRAGQRHALGIIFHDAH